MSATNDINPPGVTAAVLKTEMNSVNEIKQNKKWRVACRMNGKAYFNMLLRTMTPKRLSPPNPITIAFSDVPALL